MNIINRCHMTRAVFALLALAVAPAGASRADIFQWEYIDPADPSQGKQQSTTLSPDGAGVVAAPGVDLSYRNLTQAYLFGADLDAAYLNGATLTRAYLSQANLTGASFWYSTLTNADLSKANLSNATFVSAAGWGFTTLTNADLTDAVVVGAWFMGTTFSGFTKEQLYSTASYKNHDLSGIRLVDNDLTGWNFAGQNLTNADFAICSPARYCGSSTLTNVDLTDAVIVGANFAVSTSNGFTKEQLYSTASYRIHDLSGVGLSYNDLTDWNFAGQNLTDAAFSESTLTNVDLTDATVVGASFASAGLTKEQLYSTASYKNHDLPGINLAGNDLTGWNFASQNLTNASFVIYFPWGDYSSTLNDAVLTDAVIAGADFGGATWSGFTKEQLYSTASYKNHDLSGIGFLGSDLTGWNFAGQNLTNAVLSYWDFSKLTDADFRGADTRGAMYLSDLASSPAIVGNTILPYGHIPGVDLNASQSLVVRDYDGNPDPWIGGPPIPIHVDDHFIMGPGGVLQMLFEADAWDSTISFEPGIPVTFTGGTLELQLAAGVVPTSQIGRTFHVFDWTGVSPIGEFNIVSPYVWDASRLYSAGEITFVGVVPEPASLWLALMGLAGSTLAARRRFSDGASARGAAIAPREKGELS
jgi:uncharacterized protein YjbI with pentapeptide repeats